MNQRNFKRALVLWVLVIALLLLGSEALLAQALLEMTRPSPYEGQTRYNFHVVLITEDQNVSFWNDVHNGALSIADENSVAVEWRQASRSQGDSVSELIDIAGMVGVDGILTCVTDDDNITVAINSAVARGIPVITLGNDDPNSSRKGCVGVDNYALGVTIGNLLLSSDFGSRNVVVITREPARNQQISGKILAAGLNSVVRKLPKVKVEYLQSAEESLTIEAMVRDVALQKRRADTVICRSIEDTLTCANAVIENNLVGKIKIIGYNENQEVLEYVEKGIVQAVITTNGVTVGKSAMESYLSLSQHGWTNEFISNKIEVIRRDNVGNYLAKYDA